tara:strand:+ start:8689 stop:10008 length:1320 start_codon:yes stop_codon:yes gene_type:complete
MNNLNNKIALINARLIDPESGLDTNGEILIKNKIIKDIGKNLFNNSISQDYKIIDCKKNILCPGLIDICTHLREPGEEYKENIESASKAALSGGISSIICMPDTNPTIDQISVIEFIARRARETNGVKIFPAASITKGLNGEQLTEMGLLKEAGAILFSEGNQALSNTKIMKQALEYAKNFDALIMQHPQDYYLASNGVMNSGQLASKLGLPGIPKVAEIIQIERDLRLVESIGGKIHFNNVTTQESIEAIIKAKKNGLNVTCSTSPHYFTLNEDAVDEWKTFAKVTPPLRLENDRKYIYNSIIKNNIDIITSHHSPQDQDSKRVPFEQAEFGIIGLETLLPLSLRLHFEGKMKIIDIINKLSYQPAKLLNLTSGRLKKNAPADICIFDPNYSYKINIDKMKSRSKNSLFDNYNVKGKILATIIDGRIMYKSSKFKINN